ncbi:hypothetical protein AT6N2_C1578 [Agrobacterium tumefaciens]|nr:hypothetical protein AT6N2_C1578 [Agrobacterium tumefaciens]
MRFVQFRSPARQPDDTFVEAQRLFSPEIDEIAAQPLRVAAADLGFYFRMGLFPDRERGCEHGHAVRRQPQPFATLVLRILLDADQPAPLQRLQRRRQRRAVHGQKIGDRPHRRRLRPVQRHQQRKLTVIDAHRLQRIVEQSRQRPCRALCMQAKAGIAHEKSCRKRNHAGV